MTSAGIRYSNIEPDHEIRAEPRPTGVSARPRRNQCSAGDVALGDREEAGQARLRGEQVVVARVERAVRRRGSRSRRACASGRRGSRSPSRGRAAGHCSAIARRRRSRSGRSGGGVGVGPVAAVAASAASASVCEARGWSGSPAPPSAAGRGRGVALDRPAGRLGPGDELAPSPSPRSSVSAAATSASVWRGPRARRADAPSRRGVSGGVASSPAERRPAPRRGAAASASGSAGRRRSPRPARRVRAIASSIPAERAADRQRLVEHPRHALARVSRWPARLPLSTVET